MKYEMDGKCLKLYFNTLEDYEGFIDMLDVFIASFDAHNCNYKSLEALKNDIQANFNNLESFVFTEKMFYLFDAFCNFTVYTYQINTKCFK